MSAAGNNSLDWMRFLALPAQHLNHADDGYDLEPRSQVRMARVIGRDPVTNEPIYDRDTFGDWLGLVAWRPSSGGPPNINGGTAPGTTARGQNRARPIAGWMAGWPTIVTTPPIGPAGAPPGDATPINGGTAPGTSTRGVSNVPAGVMRVRPIVDESGAPDEQYEERGPVTPDWASKYPKDWTGIMHAGSTPHDQAETWHPDALGLVASEFGRAGSHLSTAILDLDGENKIDPSRRTLLHRHIRGVKGPTGLGFDGRNATAWQIGYSQSDGSAGMGLVADSAPGAPPVPPASGPTTETGAHDDPPGDGDTSIRDAGGAAAPSGTAPGTSVRGQATAARAVLGATGARGGGPFLVRGAGNPHQLGVSADSEPISSTLISSDSIIGSPFGDASILFEGGYSDPGPHPHRARGHIMYDPRDAHPWVGGARAGRFKVLVETLIYVSKGKKISDPYSPLPPDGPPDGPIPPGGGGDGSEGIGGVRGGGDGHGDQPPGDGDGSGNGPPTGEPPPLPPDVPPYAPDPFGPPAPPAPFARGSPDPTPPTEPPVNPPPGPDGSDIDQNLSGDDDESVWDSIIDDLDRHIREHPEQYPPGTTVPPRGGPLTLPSDQAPKNRPFAASTMEVSVPGVIFRPQPNCPTAPDLRNDPQPSAEAVERHDENTPIVARMEASSVRPSCNPALNSTSGQPGTSRYAAGTSSGQVTLFPAEVGIEDDASDYAPKAIARSSVGFNVLPVVGRIGWGLPHLKPGAATTLRSGFSSMVNAAGELVHESHDAAGANTTQTTLSTTALTLAKKLRLKSGGSQYHEISAYGGVPTGARSVGLSDFDIVFLKTNVGESSVPVVDSSGYISTSFLPPALAAGGAGRFLGTSLLTSGTTFTAGASTNKIKIRMVGGGGGGGGVTSAVAQSAAAGGGAAGAYAEKTFAVAPSTGYTYAIGAAGAAGANTGGDGGSGGDTTFQVGATTVTAYGALGGSGDLASASPSAALGGLSETVAANGDVNSGGAPGQSGLTVSATLAISGFGGSSQFGSGGKGRANANGPGSAGLGYGAGGGGGAQQNGGSAAVGGVGTAGCIVVDEYS